MHMYYCKDYRGKTNFPDYQEIKGFGSFGFNLTKQSELNYMSSYGTIRHALGNVIWTNISF